MEGQFAALSTEVCLFITALPEGKPCTTFGSGLIGSRGGIEALVGPSAGFLLLLSAATFDQLHPLQPEGICGEGRMDHRLARPLRCRYHLLSFVKL